MQILGGLVLLICIVVAVGMLGALAFHFGPVIGVLTIGYFVVQAFQ